MALPPRRVEVGLLVGQNTMPDNDDPLVDLLDPKNVNDNLANVRDVVRQCVQAMPTHGHFIAENCSVPAMPG